MFGSILNREQHHSFLLFEADHKVGFLGIRLFGDAQRRSVSRLTNVHAELVSRGHEHNIARNMALSRGIDLLLCQRSPGEEHNKQRNSILHAADCIEESCNSHRNSPPRPKPLPALSLTGVSVEKVLFRVKSPKSRDRKCPEN